MSKVGRYSAQRRKVKDLGTTATTITAAQCGTEFLINQNGTANITHTLPNVADAQQGWWCAFTLATAVAHNDADVTIAAEGTIVHGVEGGDANAPLAGVTNVLVEGNAAAKGTRVEYWTDGAAWFVTTLASTDTAITTS